MIVVLAGKVMTCWAVAGRRNRDEISRLCITELYILSG